MEQWQKLDSRSVWVFWIQSIIAWIVIAAITIFLISYILASLPLPGLSTNFFDMVFKATALYVVGWLAIILFSLFWAFLTYQNWQFKIDEDKIEIERGIIVKRKVAIPFERVQNVDIIRTLLSRLFGLSDLQISTAGYSGAYISEGRLPGLSKEKAEQLREEILVKLKKTHSRAGV